MNSIEKQRLGSIPIMECYVNSNCLYKDYKREIHKIAKYIHNIYLHIFVYFIEIDRTFKRRKMGYNASSEFSKKCTRIMYKHIYMQGAIFDKFSLLEHNILGEFFLRPA
ncbi:hypothetical protein YYC_02583 [Plasmodium yoelii 17X]|uniref:Uncharacterized protein n=1 Tax=Plasmodium yoelii 17X TaxID=1323249 RepID=V7PL14_PLAYE|nr:hypothetical protein YYC_02583 [Plasmodium yoelii 17X]